MDYTYMQVTSVCRFHERKLIGFYLIFKKKDHFLETSSSKC